MSTHAGRTIINNNGSTTSSGRHRRNLSVVTQPQSQKEEDIDQKMSQNISDGLYTKQLRTTTTGTICRSGVGKHDRTYSGYDLEKNENNNNTPIAGIKDEGNEQKYGRRPKMTRQRAVQSRVNIDVSYKKTYYKWENGGGE